MEWLNLHTSVLDSPEVIGAEPLDRATWLMLLRYCIGQENSGIIRDCKQWKDRRWQQLAKITQEEVGRFCELWKWVENDLHILHYPIEKEQEVKHLRAIGKTSTAAKASAAAENGKRGGRPPKTQRRTQQKTKQKTQHETEHKPNKKPIEGKGREEERKGREEEAEAAAAASAANISAHTLVDAYPRRSHLADALREAAACMTRHDPAAVLAGTKAIAAVVSRWTESERMQFLKKPPEFFAGDHWADDPQLWLSRRERPTAVPADMINLGGRAPSVRVTC